MTEESMNRNLEQEMHEGKVASLRNAAQNAYNWYIEACAEARGYKNQVCYLRDLTDDLMDEIDRLQARVQELERELTMS